MKLTSELLQLLTKTCTVANVLGISEIAMEDTDNGKVLRGMADVGTPVVILHHFDEEMEFQDLAIRDTKTFISKLELAQDRDDNFRVFVDVDKNRNSVSGFDFKGKKFKMNFVAGSSRAIRSPKQLNDANIAKFEMDVDAVNTLNRAVKAMVGEFVTFICDGDEVSFEIKTASNDVFSYTFTNKVSSNDDEDPSFVYSYPVKSILSIIKNSDDKIFNIGKRGILNTQIQETNVHLLPRV